MLALLLANWRVVIFLGTVLSLGSAIAYQSIGWRICSANFAQFRAEVASAAAEAEVQNAQVALHQAQAAQEVVSDLQARYVALESRYRVLRANTDSSRPVSGLSDAAGRDQLDLMRSAGNDNYTRAMVRSILHEAARLCDDLGKKPRERNLEEFRRMLDGPS